MQKIRNSSAWVDFAEEMAYSSDLHRELSTNGFARVNVDLDAKDVEWWFRIKSKLTNGDACHGGRMAYDLDLRDIPEPFFDKIFSADLKESVCAYFCEDQKTDKFRLRNVENIVVHADSPDQPLHRDHSLGPHVVLTVVVSMNKDKPLQTRFVPGSHKSNQLDGEAVRPSVQALCFDCATLHGGSAQGPFDDYDRLFFVIEHPSHESSARMNMVEGGQVEKRPTRLIHK